MLKIERKSVHIDEDTWFYVSRKSLYMVHWQGTGSWRRCATFRVPVHTLRSALTKLGVQSAKDKKRRIRRAMEERR